jgi:hypothetical protein
MRIFLIGVEVLFLKDHKASGANTVNVLFAHILDNGKMIIFAEIAEQI